MTAIPVLIDDLEVNGLICSSVRPWRATSAPRVLIVEDDRDVQEGWRVFLRHQGYDVLSADDGATGLALVENEEPDIVLLDLGLPGMNGLKFLHEVRMRGLPAKVVVVTAMSSPEVDRRAFSHGAGAVVGKPTTPHRLVSVIEHLLDG